MALLEQAAAQGHAYAMQALGGICCQRYRYELCLEWFTKGAEAGLPDAMYRLGSRLQQIGRCGKVASRLIPTLKSVERDTFY